MTKKTLVIGGSLKPERYSNKAIRRLLAYNQEVVSIGLRAGKVENISIETEMQPYKDIHTVTIYLNPHNQLPYHDYIIGLAPKRIIFNPGTENSIFAQKCSDAGIDVIEHCTLVMLDAGIY